MKALRLRCWEDALSYRWDSLDARKIWDDLDCKVMAGFPVEEKYGLTFQFRRAPLSIPANIVEECSQNGDKELVHFVNISFGSQAETKYLLHAANPMKHQDESISADIETPVRSFWPKALELLSASQQGRIA